MKCIMPIYFMSVFIHTHTNLFNGLIPSVFFNNCFKLLASIWFCSSQMPAGRLYLGILEWSLMKFDTPCLKLVGR